MSIEAMKQALKALEHDNPAGRSATITALRQAIEQAKKQEPVAQCTNSDSWNCKYCRKTETCEALKDPRNFGTPTRREWAGLTNEDMSAAWAQSKGDVLFRLMPFARTIEAKLKEKNT